MGVFVELMHSGFGEFVPHVRVRIGYLHVLEDFIRQLKTRIEPFIPTIFETLFKIAKYETLNDVKEIEENDFENNENENESIIVLKRQSKKEIRQHILKRFKEIYELPIAFNFDAYSEIINTEFIAPRLENFANENSQGSSSLLELIHVWTMRKSFLKYLVWNGNDIFNSVLSVLSAKKVQKDVVGVVIDMLEHVLLFSMEDGMDDIGAFDSKTELLIPNIPSILMNLKSIFDNPVFSEGANLNFGSHLTRSIKIISSISSLVVDKEIGVEIMNMLLPFLKKNSKVAPEHVKLNVLIIFESFIPSLALRDTELYESSYFKVLASLFSTLRNIDARKQLSTTFHQFAVIDPEFLPVSTALINLNTYTLKKLDSRDFGKMFDGFNEITSNLVNILDHFMILPILYNMIFSILDENEYSVRTSASYALKLFITRAAIDQSSPLMNLVEFIVFPGIKKGIRFAPESSRQEFIQLLGHIIEKSPTNPLFTDMTCLLGNNDEDLNFFKNIYHIQSHRRSRAVRRFSEFYQQISVSNISNVFIPILIHFIFESDKTSDHQITNDSLLSIGECSSKLPWGQYYALLKRFLYNISKKPVLEKIMIRTTVAIVDNFHFNINAVEVSPITELIENNVDEDEEIEVSTKVPGSSRIVYAVVDKIIPELQKHLALEQDESISVRVPVAESIARLLKSLPKATMEVELPKLLLKLCNLLKSRLQDTRDTSREVLVKIQLILGPKYLYFILNELQTALTRGYQLHVLGWSANAIISGLLPSLNGRSEELDVCVDVIMKILINDLFSDIGLERDVEGLKGKMKEIKVTKSYQTCQLLSAAVSVSSIGKMMIPLKEIMLESKETKITAKIDEVLRCFSVGLSKNTSITTSELLKFIFGLLSESLPIYQINQIQNETQNEYRIVKLGRPTKENTLKYFQSNVHRFLEFGLNLLLQIMRLEEYDRDDKTVLGMFDSLTIVICKLLYSKHDSIVSLTVRCLLSLLKIELPIMTSTFPVILKQCFRIISTNRARDSPLMQNTFKFVIAIIRDKKDVTISNLQLGSLLSILKLDLEETDRHSTSFSLIKVIVGRKLVIEELYDVMDTVGNLMITSQTTQIRELARHTFVQFLIDYPQGEQRLQKQMSYILKNMNYEFETGRESVLETIHLCIKKFVPLSEYSQILFLSLVMQMVNDESAKCREMSALLIKELISVLERSSIDPILILLNQWFESGQLALQRATLQVYSIMIELSTLDKSSVSLLLTRIDVILHDSELFMRKMNWNEDREEPVEEIFPNWQIAYYALTTFEKLIVSHGQSAFSSPTIWESIIKLISHPHEWIRKCVVRIFSSISTLIDADTLLVNNSSISFAFLASTENMVNVSRKLVSHLLRGDLDESVADYVIKSLFFLSKHIYKHESTFNTFLEDADDLEDKAANSGFLARLVKRLCVMCRKASIYLKDVTNLMVIIKRGVFIFRGRVFSSITLR